MPNLSRQDHDSSPARAPVLIHELEGVTILRAKLIVAEDGKDALLLDTDDGTSVIVSLRQEAGANAFLEVSGENVLMGDSH
ncbi:MAG TPA: hypothetical protein VLC92_12500 [Rhodocyclaceae bacterium]|nr:hypothetical protein [Rhodocyclaceae bacterium]